MATAAVAVGGPDRMAASASSATAAGLTGAVAAQRLLSLLALAVSILFLFPQCEDLCDCVIAIQLLDL